MTRKVPTFDELMNPLLRALHILGGSGTIREIDEKVAEIERFPDEVLAVPQDPEKSSQSQVEYRLAWARSWLKKYGLLENSNRGVWALTAAGKKQEKVDYKEVVRAVRAMQRMERQAEGGTADGREEGAPEEDVWKQDLLALLTKKLSPSGFERLAQRLLRESGFIQVEVTGRTGDGGIDGRGIARFQGLLSFHVLFQCKRFQGSVGSPEMRNFRGAMVGRSDKGLFITTGTFSPAAIKEASRDGAPPIDLIDGDALAEKLKELGLGVKTERVEVSRVDELWFENI